MPLSPQTAAEDIAKSFFATDSPDVEASCNHPGLIKSISKVILQFARSATEHEKMASMSFFTRMAEKDGRTLLDDASKCGKKFVELIRTIEKMTPEKKCPHCIDGIQYKKQNDELDLEGRCFCGFCDGSGFVYDQEAVDLQIARSFDAAVSPMPINDDDGNMEQASRMAMAGLTPDHIEQVTGIDTRKPKQYAKPSTLNNDPDSYYFDHKDFGKWFLGTVEKYDHGPFESRPDALKYLENLPNEEREEITHIGQAKSMRLSQFFCIDDILESVEVFICDNYGFDDCEVDTVSAKDTTRPVGQILEQELNRAFCAWAKKYRLSCATFPIDGEEI